MHISSGYILEKPDVCVYCDVYGENVLDEELDENICQDCLNERNEADYKYCDW